MKFFRAFITGKPFGRTCNRRVPAAPRRDRILEPPSSAIMFILCNNGNRVMGTGTA